MAQYRVESGAYDSKISNHFEVMMLANGANGNIVSTSNPLPVTLGSENITITGNVNFVDTVNVASSPENPVHTHITEVGTSGNLSISYLPIGGNVNVTNIVSVTGNVTANGTVNIGNLPATQTVNGTINIGNSVQVNVGNFPSTQTVNGTINIGNTVQVNVGNVNVTNIVSVTGNVTANGIVNIGNLPATQTVNGSVFLSNGTIAVTQSGSWNINNFPATQTVNGSVFLSNSSIVVTGNVTTNGTINVGNFPSTQTVNGTINIGNTVQVNVINFPVTQNVVVTNTPNVNATITGTVTSTVIDGATDAFGRLRISDSFTLGDYKHLYGIDPNFLDITANGGTITFQTNQACARLTTNTSPTASVIHQSKLYHQYMPGKSQLIKTTINFYGNTANVTKRTGYFDANNGIFFEQSGNGTLSFCIRTDTSGTISDARKIPQSQWNIDKCDGTGPSYFNLDITKTQIFFTDFQWLGVGRVSWGFVHDGKFVTAHEFYNSNNLETVYMSHPNLPVRCEIFNTGATTGGFMDQICSTVMAEGGYREVGQDWGATSPTMRTMAANAVLPLLAIRLKNTFGGYPHNRMSVKLETTNVFTTAENIKYRIIKLPNRGYLTGGAWSSVNANSGVEFNATATAFINGEELGNGYIAAATQGSKSVATSGQASPGALSRKNFIVQNFDSTNSEIYIISVENISSASTNVGVGLQWREIY